MAGFVIPGSRVDILSTAKVNGRQIAFPLLVDMLVLALEGGMDFKDVVEIRTVSFAINREQALLLQLARSRGCQMSLVLRGPDKAVAKETWSLDDARRLLASENFAAEPEVP